MKINTKFETFLATLVKDGVAFRRDYVEGGVIAWNMQDGVTRCYGPLMEEEMESLRDDPDSMPSGFLDGQIDLHNSASVEAMRKAYDYCRDARDCGKCQLWTWEKERI